nr:VP30 [Loetschberg virus]
MANQWRPRRHHGASLPGGEWRRSAASSFCRSYMTGACKFGARCRYSHSVSDANQRERLIFTRLMTDRLCLLNQPPSDRIQQQSDRLDDLKLRFREWRTTKGSTVDTGCPLEEDACKLLLEVLGKGYQGLGTRDGVVDVTAPEHMTEFEWSFLGARCAYKDRIQYLKMVRGNKIIQIITTAGLVLEKLDATGSTVDSQTEGPTRGGRGKGRHCRYYRNGRCNKSSSCMYSHNPFKMSENDLTKGIAANVQMLAELDISGATNSKFLDSDQEKYFTGKVLHKISRELKAHPEKIVTHLKHISAFIWWIGVNLEQDVPLSVAEMNKDPGWVTNLLLELKSLPTLKSVETVCSSLDPKRVIDLIACLLKFGVFPSAGREGEDKELPRLGPSDPDTSSKRVRESPF